MVLHMMKLYNTQSSNTSRAVGVLKFSDHEMLLVPHKICWFRTGEQTAISTTGCKDIHVHDRVSVLFGVYLPVN